MPTVKVKYKYRPNSKIKSHVNSSTLVSYQRTPPTESAVLAEIRKHHPKYEDIIILEIK